MTTSIARGGLCAVLPVLAALAGCSSDRLTLYLAPRANEQTLALQEEEPKPF